MGKILSEAQIAAFGTDGYVSPIRIYTEDECDAFRAAAEAFEAARPGDAAWAFDIKANLLFDWVYEFSTKPRMLDLVEDLIGPDILLTDAIFRLKDPGSSTHYGWHQDAARIEVDPPFLIAYLAIGEATLDNGCLRVIPGSHGRIEPFGFVSYGKRQVARVKHVDESRAVDLVLRKGEVGIFNCNTIHGSGQNRSSERRFALINDYSRPDCMQRRGRGSGQLVRGADRFGYIAREPVPAGSCTDTEVLARRRVLCTYPENVLMGPLEPGEAPSFLDRDDAVHVRLPEPPNAGRGSANAR